MEIFLDALIDSLKLLPVLFAVYILIEFLEHKNNNKVHHLFMRAQKAGPLLGGLFGCIPQCGFSVVASELFSGRAITLGTLVAIFISTSDEAIPILLSHPSKFGSLAFLICIKLLFAVLFGFIIDLLVKQRHEHTHCEHEHTEHEHFHGNCEDCHDGIVKSAIIHSVRIFLFIFAVSLLLGFAVECLGTDFSWLKNRTWLQPLVTPLVGLIPNCAASVVLTEVYVEGIISLGALVGGLCAGSGVGLIVLLKLNKNMKQNVGIIALMYLIGVISGYIIQAIPFVS